MRRKVLTVFARKMATVVSEGMAEKVKPMKIPMIDIRRKLVGPYVSGRLSRKTKA